LPLSGEGDLRAGGLRVLKAGRVFPWRRGESIFRRKEGGEIPLSLKRYGGKRRGVVWGGVGSSGSGRSSSQKRGHGRKKD